MRLLVSIVVGIIALCGCASSTKPPVAYDPATFRADIARLIDAKDYRGAVALVKAADVDRQVSADRAGYMAIGGLAIYLPGVDSKVVFDRSRDWYVPGTSDAIQDGEWQRVATEFAARYNARRLGMSG
jgi:hypothetical protein